MFNFHPDVIIINCINEKILVSPSSIGYRYYELDSLLKYITNKKDTEGFQYVESLWKTIGIRVFLWFGSLGLPLLMLWTLGRVL